MPDGDKTELGSPILADTIGTGHIFVDDAHVTRRA